MTRTSPPKLWSGPSIQQLALSFQQWANLLSTILQFLLFPSLGWLFVWLLTQGVNQLGWFSATLLQTFGLPLLGLFLLYRIAAWAIARLGGKEIYVVLVNRFLFPLFLCSVVLAFLALLTDLSLLGNTQLFTLAGTPITLRSLFFASIGLYFWFSGVQGIAKLLRKLLLRQMQMDEGALDAALILFRYFLIGLGLFLAFNELNLDSTAIAAVSGGLAVGIGFGLKDIVINFLSGIVLLFERSLHPGDIIEIEGQMGRVEDISLRATTIKTNDEVEIVVPNQIFFTNVLTSYTRQSRRARFGLKIPIPCEHAPETVIPILLSSVQANTNVLTSLTAKVEISSLSQSVIYNLRIWTNDPLRIDDLRSDLYRQIWLTLSQHGIEPIEPSDISVNKNLAIERPPQTLPAAIISPRIEPLHQGSSQIELVSQSFEKIKPYANDFVASFYETLFQENPKVRSLFKNTNMDKMHQKLLESLVLLVDNLQEPEALRPVLQKLGARHKTYGVVAQYYPMVGDALLATFPKYIPDDWHPEVEKAWTDTFQAVMQIMLEGADEL
ncbi:MAG: mechanosensitive ion channel domain-containing protein [Cyanobacteria bacterium P01_G01_bin.54]